MGWFATWMLNPFMLFAGALGDAVTDYHPLAQPPPV